MKNMDGPMRRSRAGDRLTRITFTLNNWTDEEYKFLTEWIAANCTWGIVGKETCPDTGTLHLQGACILGTRWSFSKLKTLTGFKRCHIEPMKGKPVDSLVYCSKEDSQPFVTGTLPEPGKRTDVLALVKRIQQGQTLKELAKDEEGGVGVVKYHNGLTRLSSLLKIPRTEPPCVFWFHGKTGTGKTRSAWECARALVRAKGLSDSNIWYNSGLRWYNGYDGQLCAIIDDFRTTDLKGIGFNFFLRLLDRYPFEVEFKGGFINWAPHYIFITCPDPPREEFRVRDEHRHEDLEQLMRRITHVRGFDGQLDDIGLFEVVNDIMSLCGSTDLALAREQMPDESDSLQ